MLSKYEEENHVTVHIGSVQNDIARAGYAEVNILSRKLNMRFQMWDTKTSKHKQTEPHKTLRNSEDEDL